MNRFLPFEWIAATRFLREGAAQSLLIITGVSIGIAVIVFMSALIENRSPVLSSYSRALCNGEPVGYVVPGLPRIGSLSFRWPRVAITPRIFSSNVKLPSYDFEVLPTGSLCRK